jgi:hypothetical protein
MAIHVPSALSYAGTVEIAFPGNLWGDVPGSLIMKQFDHLTPTPAIYPSLLML